MNSNKVERELTISKDHKKDQINWNKKEESSREVDNQIEWKENQIMRDKEAEKDWKDLNWRLNYKGEPEKEPQNRRQLPKVRQYKVESMILRKGTYEYEKNINLY